MTDEEPTFSMDVKIQRGNGTDDRDTLKATVQANDLDTLDQRREAMTKRLEAQAQQVRAIQPDERDRMPEDQTTLADQEVDN
jgi:hypothetical protein